jgi:ATP-dependent Clp protease ATP-binding subunit ClpA
LKTRINNCILVGEAGTGKSILVKEVARRLKDSYDFFELDFAGMASGTQWRWDIEKRLKNLLNSIMSYSRSDKKPVLFADEFHLIVNFGAKKSDESATLANFLKPYLAYGEIIL